MHVEGVLRLTGSSPLMFPAHSSGRLEIYKDGVWGSVCSDSFAMEEADVACKQLGYIAGFEYGGVVSFG